jgi:hypothetical protein
MCVMLIVKINIQYRKIQRNKYKSPQILPPLDKHCCHFREHPPKHFSLHSLLHEWNRAARAVLLPTLSLGSVS